MKKAIKNGAKRLNAEVLQAKAEVALLADLGLVSSGCAMTFSDGTAW